MKIQDQVCTLQQAKTLKELGVEQKSLFNWICVMPDPAGERYYFDVMGIFDKEETLTEIVASAFSVWELGLMLPQTIEFNKTQKASIKIVRFNAWTISYSRHSSGIDVCSKESPSEVEARAAMLIYLLENNHITAGEVNARLQFP